MSAVTGMITTQVTSLLVEIVALAGAVAPLVATAFLITWAFKALRKFGKA